MAQNMVKLANATGNSADPEVAQVAKRRRFTNQYKLKITTEADKCTQRGDIGMLLRREGLYSWHLKYFRQWRDNMSTEKKPSPKSSTIAQLRYEPPTSYIVPPAGKSCYPVDILFISDHCLLGFGPRFVRVRDTVMSEALHGYVRCAHRLCARRASMHQGRRHYHHNRYNRYV